ncbi:hypothetical protein CO657_29435 (plasmid) [Rhizobium acidisoli]|uniref:Uncharacterized protein n=1 Tax=Rhizobium acidisoli TaxID=1538158 RepID=A0AAE5WUB5_9HYPH|nr:hypothetical protein CO657_29435 [Rhizobium acidisoli]
MSVLTTCSLIPVLGLDPRGVTGIQRAQVLGRGRLLFVKRSIHGADAPWLDSCDIPRVEPADRNEGERGVPLQSCKHRAQEQFG